MSTLLPGIAASSDIGVLIPSPWFGFTSGLLRPTIAFRTSGHAISDIFGGLAMAIAFVALLNFFALANVSVLYATLISEFR